MMARVGRYQVARLNLLLCKLQFVAQSVHLLTLLTPRMARVILKITALDRSISYEVKGGCRFQNLVVKS